MYIFMPTVSVDPPTEEKATSFVIQHADVFATLIVVAVIAAIMSKPPVRMVVLGMVIALVLVWLAGAL